MLRDRQKIITICVILPLMILLVNSTLALQLLVKYHALVENQIEAFRTSKNEDHLTKIEDMSQSMINRFRIIIVLVSVISIMVCTIAGFLVSRQLVGSSQNLSREYLQRELKFARERIDSLINMLEKQESSQE